jgi:hypothetical protein
MRKAKRLSRGQNVTEEQYRLLDEAGFIWEPEDAKFEDNFNKLLRYKEENGHLYVEVKRCKIEGLGWWVSWIRKNKHKLTAEQIARIDSIGFEWNSDIAYRKRNNIKGILDK